MINYYSDIFNKLNKQINKYRKDLAKISVYTFLDYYEYAPIKR